jgi:SAM-dependent methyltransferase
MVGWQHSRQWIIAGLRKAGLFTIADEIRFWAILAKTYAKNRAYANAHPKEAFPPFRISYDAYGTVDYDKYWTGGMLSAEAILTLVKGEIELSGAKILEWGCGPGRIVRQLERLGRGYGAKVSGCDYNRASIAWCASAISEVTFALNELTPPLPFEESVFDMVYSLSVFTHLSEEMHYAWLKENLRVLKHRGLLLFTTHGDRLKYKLLPLELAKYETGKIVVRASGKEGKRSYAAFQSPAFVKQKLLSSVPGIELVRHETQSPLAGIQDIWVVRKS